MSATDLGAVQDQIQKYWAARFTKKFRSSLLLGGLVDKSYSGSIVRGGDTVRVSQVNNMNGQLLTVGTNADSFDPEAIATQYVDIKADKRAVASVEFQDLVELQSQLSHDHPEVVDAMNFALGNQVNEYLYGLVAPSGSSPDHTVTGVTDFNSSQLSGVRTLAAKAKWAMDKGWYGLLDPQYYSDLLNSTTIVSSDFNGGEAPTIGGVIGQKRFGFNLFEDNSRGADYGLFFHPDFLHMVTQQEVRVKISETHSTKKFGIIMSIDLVFGAKLGNDGAIKHITVTA